MTPYSPWGKVLSYKIYPLFYLLLGSMHTFFGWGGEDEFSAGKILHRGGGEFSIEREISRGCTFQGSFTLGVFARILIQNFFICLAFSLPIQF